MEIHLDSFQKEIGLKILKRCLFYFKYGHVLKKIIIHLSSMYQNRPALLEELSMV